MRGIYPLELIRTSLFVIHFMKEKKALKRTEEVFRSMVVYAIMEINGQWLALTRDYKPLGLHGYEEWVKYEDYPFLLIPKENVNFEKLKEYSLDKVGDTYFLFNDTFFPDKGLKKKRYIKAIEEIFFESKKIIDDGIGNESF